MATRCAWCDGIADRGDHEFCRGKIWEQEVERIKGVATFKCPICEGRGYVAVQVWIENAHDPDIDYGFCGRPGGRHRDETRTCHFCFGVGKLEFEPKQLETKVVVTKWGRADAASTTEKKP